MKKLKTFLIIISLVWAWSINCQISWKEYSSPDKDFSFNYPSTYKRKVAIGANVKFKATDNKGNSIVVVKKWAGYDGEIEDILSISKEEWESSIPLINGKFIKSGKAYSDHQNGFYLIYSATDIDSSYTVVYSSYQFLNNGNSYTIITACNKKNYEKMDAVFYRVKQSFDIKGNEKESHKFNYYEHGSFKEGRGYLRIDSSLAFTKFVIEKDAIYVNNENGLEIIYDILHSKELDGIFMYNGRISPYSNGQIEIGRIKDRTMNSIVSVIPPQGNEKILVVVFRDKIDGIPFKMRVYRNKEVNFFKNPNH